MEKLAVVHFKYNRETEKTEPSLIEIDDTLESMQALVDGSIEVYPLTREVVIVCNDEGKLLGLPITAVAISEFASAPEMIAGDFFVCRRDEENLVGLRESDLFTMGKRVYTIDSLAR